MPLILPDVGEVNTFKYLIDYWNSNTLPIFCLYQNDLTPDADTILSDFTECDFGMYVRLTTFWSAPGLVSDRAETAGSALLWFCDGTNPQNVYGYFAIGILGELLYAERVPGAPIPMTDPTSSLQINPVFTLASEF